MRVIYPDGALAQAQSQAATWAQRSLFVSFTLIISLARQVACNLKLLFSAGAEAQAQAQATAGAAGGFAQATSSAQTQAVQQCRE